MKILRAYRYRPRTGPHHDTVFVPHAGCSRFVWNKMLALQRSLLADSKRCLPYEGLTAHPVPRREQHSFLKEAHPQILQQRLEDLSDALGA